MVTIIIIEIQYIGLLYSFILFISLSPLYLLDLSSSLAFLLILSLLAPSIVFAIVECYLCIIMIKKLIKFDSLTYCHYHTYYILLYFVDSA